MHDCCGTPSHVIRHPRRGCRVQTRQVQKKAERVPKNHKAPAPSFHAAQQGPPQPPLCHRHPWDTSVCCLSLSQGRMSDAGRHDSNCPRTILVVNTCTLGRCFGVCWRSGISQLGDGQEYIGCRVDSTVPVRFE